MDRREFIQFGAVAGAALIGSRALAQEDHSAHQHGGHGAAPPVETQPATRTGRPRVVAPGGQIAVETPNGSTHRYSRP